MKRPLSCAIVVALCGTVAHAHHSIAGMYDESRRVTVDGIRARLRRQELVVNVKEVVH